MQQLIQPLCGKTIGMSFVMHDYNMILHYLYLSPLVRVCSGLVNVQYMQVYMYMCSALTKDFNLHV